VLTVAAAIVLFLGLVLTPLGAMGLGYGTTTGYAVAALTVCLIVVGTLGVVRFWRRPD
jgi:hypothetical protein